jgi:hypothetical protein
MPQHKPLRETSNLDISVFYATENHAPVRAVTRPNATPLNDPG